MALQTVDVKGQKCIAPTLKLTSMTFKMKKGDELDVIGDCERFEEEMRDWCRRNKKTLLWVKNSENGAQIGRILF